MAASKPASPPRGTAGRERSTLLEVQELKKHYHSLGEEVRAVDGVSFDLQAGEMLAIHGPSGSGKSTLLMTVAGFIRPEGGRVLYRGQEIAALSERERCSYLSREVGFIHQSIHLMAHVKVVENAALYLILDGMSLREATAAAIPWLERVGLGQRLSHRPEQLSGGERQRVAIARVLARGPRLILADEPTGNLDSVRSAEVIELLSSIAHEQGAGVLLVTHDLEAAAIADRRMVLRDGRLLEAADQAQARGLLSGERDGANRR